MSALSYIHIPLSSSRDQNYLCYICVMKMFAPHFAFRNSLYIMYYLMSNFCNLTYNLNFHSVGSFSCCSNFCNSFLFHLKFCEILSVILVKQEDDPSSRGWTCCCSWESKKNLSLDCGLLDRQKFNKWDDCQAK